MPARAAEPNRERASDDAGLVAALRRGDEAAFAVLLERYHGALVRLARVYVADPAAAEEVAQETWLAVLRGIGRFEGRASFKTWLLRILTNQARRRAGRDARVVPFSRLGWGARETAPVVAPERFRPDEDEWAGHWASPPPDWGEAPEERLLAQETRAEIEREVAALPPTQRLVITLRDIEGWTAGEVCDALGISDANQRVLLHRARSRVRNAIAAFLEGA